MPDELGRSSTPATSHPPTSLIVCSRNRPKLFWNALSRFSRERNSPLSCALLIKVMSRIQLCPASRATRSCDIRYIWSQSIGLSRACNSGIAAAQHDLLVFTHDDVLVTASWFGSMVQSLIRAGSQAVITGRVLPTESEGTGQFAPSTKVSVIPSIYVGEFTLMFCMPDVYGHVSFLRSTGRPVRRAPGSGHTFSCCCR